jgi:hypothetical protein
VITGTPIDFKSLTFKDKLAKGIFSEPGKNLQHIIEGF